MVGSRQLVIVIEGGEVANSLRRACPRGPRYVARAPRLSSHNGLKLQTPKARLVARHAK